MGTWGYLLATAQPVRHGCLRKRMRARLMVPLRAYLVLCLKRRKNCESAARRATLTCFCNPLISRVFKNFCSLFSMYTYIKRSLCTTLTALIGVFLLFNKLLVQTARLWRDRINGETLAYVMSDFFFVNPTHAKGQLISEGYFGVFKSPKNQFFWKISALPSKMGQVIKK